MKKNKLPKILIYDIESSPNVGFTWGKWEQNVIEFLSEWQLLSFAYKWHGESDKIICYSRRNFPDVTEKTLVKKLWEVLNQADVVITHNGISFDNKKSNAKFVEHGLRPIKPAQQIDTKTIAKSNFAFNSNSLDDLGKLLKVGRKIKRMDFSVWLGCMNGDKKAFQLMEKYNKQDVQLLENVYLKLRPWATRHPNIAQIEGKLLACPNCASPDVSRKGLKYASKTVWRQYVCNNCGRYSKGEVLKVNKPGLV